MTSVVLAIAAAVQSAEESRYYAVDFIPTPPGAVEVGGMDFLPDGRLVVSTRHGQVWIVENPCAPNPAEAKLKLFAEGLYEGLGLKVVDGDVYVVQRTELSRLRDTDGDGTCDTIDTITNDWGVSGNYHEFAYGLPRDAAGNFYLSFNVSFFDPKWWHGKAPAKWRGWVVTVDPYGEVRPFASGLRSPNGLGLNDDGDLFATDNQGDWMPAGPLFHVKEGAWYGHPASLEWTDEYQRATRKASDTEPPPRPRTPPAIWLPYGLSRSAGNPLLDTTGGKFGPFAGQMFIAELTNGCVLRTDLEKVGGEWQGAALQFRRDTGSANRICFAPDGTLFVGLTNRGWGGAPPADGIARVRWLGRVPMEMKTVRLLTSAAEPGFDLGFTLPLAPDCVPTIAGSGSATTVSTVSIVSYDYNSWWDYGSPEMHVSPVEITKLELSADRTHLRVHAPKLAAGTCARIVLHGFVGRSAGASPGAAGVDEPLLHDQADYTINRLHGMKESVAVAKTVEPPAARENLEEGWVTLFDRRSMEGFDAPSWRYAAVHMDPVEPTKFADHPLVDAWDGMLVNTPGGPDAISRFLHGDCDARVEFMVPRGSNSGVYFQGRYEVQILDSFGKKEVGYGDCGGVYEGSDGQDGEKGFPGSAPRINACNAPGEWQRYDIRFRAPRFDAGGRKIANARFDWVKLNGELVQENVELTNPTRGSLPGGEVAYGPIRLQGDHDPVAYKKVKLKRIEPDRLATLGTGATERSSWTKLFDGKSDDSDESLKGWTKSGEAQWTIEEGALVGRGKAGHLFSKRGDYANLELRARMKIRHGGNSGVYFRATPATEPASVWPLGYEAQVNNSFDGDDQRTGSLYGRAKVLLAPVPDDLWFELRVRCVDEPAGTHVTIFVNDVVTADFVDATRAFQRGHVALQQHDEASEVRFQDVEVRELR